MWQKKFRLKKGAMLDHHMNIWGFIFFNSQPPHDLITLRDKYYSNKGGFDNG